VHDADVTVRQVIAVAGEALVDLVLKPDGRTTSHVGGVAAASRISTAMRQPELAR
jgi:hypothetical protein